jgi:cysteine desulfuration protein SufE
MNTQQENADALVEAFEMFDSWEDRYRFLIDLGRKLPAYPDEARTEENLVRGCQSQVWMIAQPKENAVDFVADSDSTLVKGLIAILRKVYANQPAGDVLKFDIDAFLERLGLNSNLSMSRRNGLNGMIKKVKSLAQEQAKTS